MQVKVQKLREVMALLDPAIPGKPTLPVLHSVLLKDGKAAATDLEVYVEIDLPEADMECLIPHKSVMQLLKYVPGNEMLKIEKETDGELKFNWDGGSSSYPRGKPDEYPLIPKLTTKTQGTLDGNLLIAALAAASEYCATDETRPVLSGVAILPGENLDIAAGDGYRMAYQTIAASLPIEEPLIIPSSAVRVLRSIWQHTPPDVTLGDTLVGLVTQKRQLEIALMGAEKGAAGDKLQMVFGNVSVLINLIQGTPPNFKQLIPKDIPTRVQVFPGDLERAVKRLRGIAKDGSGIVRLSWTNDTMTVSASSEETGKVEGTLPVQADNPDRVALNIKYLLEYLKGKEGMITMGVSGGTAPVMFRHRSSPLVLVMPMNAQW